jgi:hypothetical protein
MAALQTQVTKPERTGAEADQGSAPMGVVQSLSDLALRQLVGEGDGVVVGSLRDQYTDHGQSLVLALHDAHNRAWPTPETTLAGTSWWEQVSDAVSCPGQAGRAGLW